MVRIFLDTSFLLAFVDKEDVHHEKAREMMQDSIKGELYISDHVFAEAVNIVFSRSNHRKAKNFAEYLVKSEINVVQLAQPGFKSAYTIFQEDEISFTDSTIRSVMDVLGIEKLATFDKDFLRFDGIEIKGV